MMCRIDRCSSARYSRPAGAPRAQAVRAYRSHLSGRGNILDGGRRPLTTPRSRERDGEMFRVVGRVGIVGLFAVAFLLVVAGDGSGQRDASEAGRPTATGAAGQPSGVPPAEQRPRE